MVFLMNFPAIYYKPKREENTEGGEISFSFLSAFIQLISGFLLPYFIFFAVIYWILRNLGCLNQIACKD